MIDTDDGSIKANTQVGGQPWATALSPNARSFTSHTATRSRF